MIKIKYLRESVCAADDYVNHDLEIMMPDDATIRDFVEYIHHYHDDEGFSTIPYTGGGKWWALKSNHRVLAYINDDQDRVNYGEFDSETPLRSLGITEVYGTRVF